MSHMYLYNNNSNDEWKRELKPFMDEGFVTVIDWPMAVPSQLGAYNDFIEKNNKKDVWAVFFDCDEFLFPVVHKTLPEYFDQLKHPCGVGVNWACFGSGGLENYSSEPVIERFTWRVSDNVHDNTHIKSIIRMNQEVKTLGTPHHFAVENGTFNELGVPITGPFSPHSSRYLRINHYKTKSKMEWVDRCMKGKADIQNYQLNWDHFNPVQPKEVNDLTIHKYLPELKAYIEKAKE